jgi:16S rRNA (guanine966-N2)-methyltransferase
MLEAADVDFDRVLDLYAGSGALGIEALSRGAEHCTFVESDPRALAAIRENLERAGFAGHAAVARARVGQWRDASDETVTLVLADPPYDEAAAWDAIERSVRGKLAPGATIAVEHAARRGPPSRLAGLGLWRDRRQGEGAVAIYRSVQEPGADQRDTREDG